MEEANIGKLINMLSTDCARFEPLGFHFHMLYMAPIQACILFYFLWQELGIACLTGVGIIIGVLIPLQGTGHIYLLLILQQYINHGSNICSLFTEFESQWLLEDCL